jgi:hypothetical protein
MSPFDEIQVFAEGGHFPRVRGLMSPFVSPFVGGGILG